MKLADFSFRLANALAEIDPSSRPIGEDRPNDNTVEYATGYREAIHVNLRDAGRSFEIECLAWDETGGVSEERWLGTLPCDEYGIPAGARLIKQMIQQRIDDQQED